MLQRIGGLKMKTKALIDLYKQKAEEHRQEARFCEGKQWWHLAAVQHKLADEWLAKAG